MNSQRIGGTFAFFPTAQSQTKKCKRATSKRSTTVPTDNINFIAYRHDTTTKDRRATANSGNRCTTTSKL